MKAMGASLSVSQGGAAGPLSSTAPSRRSPERPTRRHGLIRRATTVSRRGRYARPGAEGATRTCHAFGDSHPVPERVDCTHQCRVSPAERAFCPRHVPQEPLGQSARDRNEPIVSKSVTRARNGHILTKKNRMIPRFVWTAKECRWPFVTDLDILARDRLRCVVSARCRARRGASRP